MKITQTILNAFVNINNVSTDFFYFLISKINFVLMRQYDLLVFFVLFFQPRDSFVVKFNQLSFSTILAFRMAFVQHSWVRPSILYFSGIGGRGGGGGGEVSLERFVFFEAGFEDDEAIAVPNKKLNT